MTKSGSHFFVATKNSTGKVYGWSKLKILSEKKMSTLVKSVIGVRYKKAAYTQQLKAKTRKKGTKPSADC